MVFHLLSARKKAGLALALLMTTQSAVAADMPILVTPPPVDRPVEFGAGWYLRGDLGYSNTQAPVIVADIVNLVAYKGAVSGGLGFGYQYNSWLRTDFELDRAVFRPGGSGAPVWCPSGTVIDWPAATANIASPSAGAPAGYLYDPHETCTPLLTSSLDRWTPMFNAYIDLGHWWGVTPYVGAGAGFSYLQSRATEALYQNWNGQPWAPNLGVAGVPLGWITANGFGTTPILPTPSSAPLLTYVANYVYPYFAWPWQQLSVGQSLKKTAWKFSWNLMAGVSYDLTENLKLDLHYRFLSVGSYTGFAGFMTGNGPITKDMVSQEIRLGFRLTAD
jgi:opacity protein-like surface antigen